MTENELTVAYGIAEGQLGLDEVLEVPSGSPVQVHAELRELQAQLETVARELAVVRELVELIAAELEVAR